MAKLISAEEAQENVAKYHERKHILEEFSAYYEDNLVPVINDLIKEGSFRGHTDAEVNFRLPDRFRYTDFNPLDWMQKQIEEAGYVTTINIENSSGMVKLSISWKSEFQF